MTPSRPLGRPLDWLSRQRPRLAAGARRGSLRVRLVVGVLVLATVGLAVVDVTAVFLLESYLVARSDAQLSAMQSRLRQYEQLRQAPDLVPPGDRAAAGTLLGTFVVELRDRDGRLTARYAADPQAPAPVLPALDLLRARGQLDTPFDLTARAGPRKRGYRVLMWVHPLDQGTTMIALDMSGLHATTGRLILIELVASLVVLLLIGTLGVGVVRVGLRPLDDVENTAEAIVAAGDLSRRIPVPANPRTEIGRLADTLNTMLTRLEGAFAQRAESEARLRRFAADASHELRTPLAGIRGFAELYRQGAAREPQQVAELLARIEAEATRMGLLVEDLLLLARLDQQRPPESEPVDLLPVAADAVEAARVIDPQRPLRLVILPELQTTGSPLPIVLGDESQLRQVATNLVSNALRHTPSDTLTVVRVGVPPGSAVAVLEVIDHGPGLTADDHERVFERFFRADPARGRQPHRPADEHLGNGIGAGLGLSIVAAIVTAHRGQVAHRPTPGGGATFSVTIPLAPPDE
ncbi:MAG: two-component system, OmpR family, sensor kinase [Pseudonocardiales bacterium]|nr:two-component system, OmpR family, sensor kinase [Pseudonocardiales bacterium]